MDNPRSRSGVHTSKGRLGGPDALRTCRQLAGETKTASEKEIKSEPLKLKGPIRFGWGLPA